MLTCDSSHESPDEDEIAGLQRIGGAHGAVVLGDHVAAAAVDHRRQEIGMLLQLLRRNVAKRLDPGQHRREAPDALLAIASAQIVFAGGVLMVDHAVGHHQPNLRVDRHQPPLKAAAIDEQRPARRAVAGDELVHDAAAHADELVLGALAREGELREIDRQAGCC